MSSRVSLALRLSTMALVFSGYLAMAAVPFYGMGLLLLPVLLFLLMPFGEWLDERFPVYSTFFKGVTVLYIAFIPLTLVMLGGLSAVIALTMYIQANLLLHRKEERAYHYIFLMAFFLLVSAAVQNPEPVIGVAMICFLVSAVWAMISLRLYVETTQASTVVPDIMPLGTTNYLPPDEQRSMFDTTLVLNVSAVSLAAVLLTVTIFLFTPRLEAGVLGRSSEPFALTGLSEEVDLHGGSYVQEDETAVMIVRFPEEPGGVYTHGEMYWRSSSFPRYQRARWSREGLRDNQDPRIQALAGQRSHHLAGQTNTESRFELQRQGRRGYDLVFQEIYMDPVPREGLPVLDLILFLEIPEANVTAPIRWAREEDFSVHLATNTARRLAYMAWSEVGSPTPEQLRADPGDYSDMDPFDYHLLTEHDLRPETAALAEQITAGENNVFDKAMALQIWLSSAAFRYSLELPPLPQDNAMDAFIMETRQGHCELFSSALALMLRSIGVPTRVVNGYRGGDWSDADRGYIVRQSMAHLWVEVLFPEYGWIRFDPSPSGEIVLTNITQLKRLLSGYSLRAKMFWYQEVVGFHGGFHLERLKNLSFGFFGQLWNPREREARRQVGESGLTAFGLFVLLAAMTMVVLGVLWRGSFLPARHAPLWLLTQDQARAAKLYKRLRRKLTRLGADCRGKTSEELWEDLRENRWIDPEVAQEVLEVYNQVRFGGRSMSHQHYSSLRRTVRNLRPLRHG